MGGVFKAGDNIFTSPIRTTPGASAAGQPGSGVPCRVFDNPVAGAVGNLQRRVSGRWQWSWDASVMKAEGIKRCQTFDLHLDVVQLGEPPEVYRYPRRWAITRQPA
jgi:hypothetical protein